MRHLLIVVAMNEAVDVVPDEDLPVLGAGGVERVQGQLLLLLHLGPGHTVGEVEVQRLLRLHHLQLHVPHLHPGLDLDVRLVHENTVVHCCKLEQQIEASTVISWIF